MTSPLRQSSILAHRAWLQARQDVLDAAAAHSGRLVALLGVAGVGKTLMLAELERHFSAAGQRVELVENGELTTGAEAAPILLVDEAARIPDAALQRLTARTDQLVVLAGLPGLAERLRQLEFHPVILARLDTEEVATYIAARLEAMGHPPARFRPEAIAAASAASGGVPRLLNLLVGSAVFAAELEGVASISAAHVRAAAEMHDLPAPLEVPPGSAAMPEADARPGPGPYAPDLDVIRELNDLPFPAKHAQGREPPPDRHPASSARGRWALLGAAVAVALGVAVVLPGRSPPPSQVVTVPEEAALTQRAPTAADGMTDAAPIEPGPSVAANVDAGVDTGAARTRPGPPPEMARLPTEPPVRIVMVYPMGDAAASARAGRLTAGFRRAGLWATSPFPVQRAEESDALRYFFEEDGAMARSIATLAGQGWVVPRLAAVPAGAPMPRPGTVEWALPRGAVPQPPRDALPESSPVAAPRLPAVTSQQPVEGSVIDAAQWPARATLRWAAPAGGGAFVEVQMLRASDAGLADWREIFAGYAAEVTQHAIALPQAGTYAWRVISTAPGVPRYTAGPWSSFSVRAAP